MASFNTAKKCFASLAVLLITAYSGSSYAQFFSKKCKTDKSPEPVWIANPGQLPAGFRYGIGAAEFNKGQSYQDQLAFAKKEARADLSNALVSVVRSEMQRTTTTRNNVVDDTFSRRIVNESDLEIPNIDQRQIWQHPKTCTLYTLLALPQRTAVLVAKKAQFKQLSAQAKNKHLHSISRKAALQQAIAIAQQHEFGQLPSSSASALYIKRLKQLQNQLNQQDASQRNAVFLLGANEQQHIVERLLPLMNRYVNGSFVAGTCNSMSDCLQQASETSAQYITIARSQLPIVQKGGLYVGQFSLSLELRDLRTGQSLASIPPQTVPVVNHAEYNVTTQLGIDRWLQKYPEGLASLTVAL